MTCSATHTFTQAELDANGSPTAASGNLSNTVTASSNEAPDATDSLDIPITQTPSMTVAKSASPTIFKAAGNIITYNYLVTNTGNVALTGITLNDDVLGAITCPATSLAVGANMTCTATYSITAGDVTAGLVTNIVTADSTQTGPTTDTFTITLGGIFDPPTAFKTINAAGLPELEFRMVWINSANVAAIDVQVTDQIPTGTTYVPDSINCAPQGTSTTVNVATVPVPVLPLIAAVPNWSCGFDAVNNQIQWQGNIGGDNGLLTEAAAQNEVVITFRATVDNAVNQVQNTGYARTDTNADGDFILETTLGSSIVPSPLAVWNRSTSGGGDPGVVELPNALPATGFAPNVITSLPKQSAEKAYAATDVWLEIPSLGVKTCPLLACHWLMTRGICPGWRIRLAGWLAPLSHPGKETVR